LISEFSGNCGTYPISKKPGSAQEQ